MEVRERAELLSKFFPEHLSDPNIRNIQKFSKEYDIPMERTFQLLSEPYPLTNQQTEALLHNQPERPVLVHAGPGSGKTTVMVRRYILLLLKGWNVPEILSVTFTHRAAGEMRSRVKRQIESIVESSETDGVLNRCLENLRKGNHWITTFHSAASRILKLDIGDRNKALITECRGDYDRQFEILNRDRQLELIREVLESNFSSESVSPNRILRKVNQWRTLLITPESAREESQKDIDTIASIVYERIQEWKRQEGLLDFHDLVFKLGTLMRKRSDVRNDLAQQFKAVLIDEFQDTNPAQQRLVNHLVRSDVHLFAVGDEKQAIFSWRGADPDGMRQFSTYFPEAKIFELKTNFRSKTYLIYAASELFVTSDGEQEYAMKPRSSKDGDHGEKPGLFEARSEQEEHRFIQFYIENKTDCEQYEYSDIAILTRLNRHRIAIRNQLRQSSIPVVEVGNSDFFDHQTTRVVLAALDCLCDVYRIKFKSGTDILNGNHWSKWATGTAGPLEDSHKVFQERSFDLGELVLNQSSNNEIFSDLSYRYQRRISECLVIYRGLAQKLHDGELFSDHLDTFLGLFFFGD